MNTAAAVTHLRSALRCWATRAPGTTSGTPTSALRSDHAAKRRGGNGHLQTRLTPVSVKNTVPTVRSRSPSRTRISVSFASDGCGLPTSTIAQKAQPVTLLPISMSRTCVSLFGVWQHRRGWPNRTCPVFVTVAFLGECLPAHDQPRQRLDTWRPVQKVVLERLLIVVDLELRSAKPHGEPPCATSDRGAFLRGTSRQRPSRTLATARTGLSNLTVPDPAFS